MSHVQYVDELVREYLLYRGFSSSLKVFDSELKSDKDRGFKVDKVVDQLLQSITAYDLNSLKELWIHLDQRMFSKLEHHFTPAVRKLENAILKLYLVNAVINGKNDKVMEFFSRLTPELQNQAEWKEWFLLPFTKCPEENPCFNVHFTRQWQDSVLVSLHNFLATIFHSMPQAVLASYDDDALLRIKKLQEENDALRQRLNSIDTSNGGAHLPENAFEGPHHQELMDDFYIIAQESGSSDANSKTLKNLIRNIGSGLHTSPILSRKPQTQNAARKSVSNTSISEEQRQPAKLRLVVKPSNIANVRTIKTTRDASVESIERKPPGFVETPPPPCPGSFLLLSQEEYSEHRSSVCLCKFNSTGTMIASADMDGVIKLWSATPNKTHATFVNKSSVLSLDWILKNERYLLTGHKMGIVRLYDTTDNKLVWELEVDTSSQLKSTSVVDICCSPSESMFVCSVSSQQSNVPSKLLLYDIKSKKNEANFSLDTCETIVNCCTFNHNGQIIFAGCSDGSIRIFDIRRSESIDLWNAHEGSVESMQLTSDFTSCYSIGRDNKLCQRSLNQNGSVMWEGNVPECSSLQNVGSPHGQLFVIDPTGSHVLVGGQIGGIIYQISTTGLEKLLDLGGHKCATTAVDWAFANQCATSITASFDGKIRTSTFLTP